MNKQFWAIGIATVLAGIPAPAAAAFCMQPHPPMAFVTKPAKPYCAISQSCSQWQVDAYKDDVRRYFQALEDYATSVDRYYKQASEYVQCMADLD